MHYHHNIIPGIPSYQIQSSTTFTKRTSISLHSTHRNISYNLPLHDRIHWLPHTAIGGEPQNPQLLLLLLLLLLLRLLLLLLKSTWQMVLPKTTRLRKAQRCYTPSQVIYTHLCPTHTEGIIITCQGLLQQFGHIDRVAKITNVVTVYTHGRSCTKLNKGRRSILTPGSTSSHVWINLMRCLMSKATRR